MRYLLIAASLLFGAPAFACDCAEPPPPKKALEGATAVFLAEAVKVEVEGQTRTVTFKVDRWWKGGDKPEVITTTHKSGATCGYDFEKGKKYMVYAGVEKDKSLRVSLCSRTRTEKEAEKSGDFKDLGEGKKPTVAIAEPRNRSGLAVAIAEASRLQNRQREMQRIEYARTLQRAHEAWMADNNRRNRELLDGIPWEPRGWEWYHLRKK
jgi:hypothetical protein